MKKKQETDAYRAALPLVAWLEKDMKAGKRRYCTKAGQQPLHTLEEVIQALLDGNLLVRAEG